MPRLSAALLALLLPGALCRGAGMARIDGFVERAAKAHASFTIPDWPQTPDALRTSGRDTIASAEADLQALLKRGSGEITFGNTAAALDHLRWKAQSAANLATLIRETSAENGMREAAAAAAGSINEWINALDHNPEVYTILRRLSRARPRLASEEKLLLDEQLREFHRAGLDLSPQSADAVAKLRSELMQLGSEFDANITQADARLTFTRAELEGMPDSFLSGTRREGADDQFTVEPNVMWQFHAIEENARREETRRKVQAAHDNLARTKNVPLLKRMLKLRNHLALRLHYNSWADYQTEIQMAKNATTAMRFIDDLSRRLEPEFGRLLSELRTLKARETGARGARIALWDWRYYAKRLEQEKFSFDESEAGNFFSFERVRDGMLATFGRIFGLQFDELAPPQKWTDRMQLYAVSDAQSAEPLGVIYFDLFTHDGKTNVGGTSEIITGKLLPDGRRQCPAVAILLNFRPATADAPALLAPADVEMLFHEFGHALHAVVTRAKFARFAGTNVPRDFVEAPSQTLQSWIWDQRVLDTFAADYRAPAKKIPAELVEKMKRARLAAAGLFYRRQCALAEMDLTLHGRHDPDQPYDCVTVANRVMAKMFLPPAADTAFLASFRGMNGYDAAYYGYAWSDVLATDMAFAFRNAPDGFLDLEMGMRFRREILETGSSRDASVSVERFLGRKTSPAAFLEKLGVADE